MSGGRPPKGKQPRYPELEELASWFHQALADAGYQSVHAFLERGFFEKNAVYGVFGATRLLTLENTQSLALALKRNPQQVIPVWMRAKEARDRTILASARSKQPTLQSWAEMPLPSLALRNLLEAQGVAADRLPYELLGVQEPPLSTVYVRQAVRVGSSRERNDREASPTLEQAVGDRGLPTRQQAVRSVRDALDRHDHLVITGEPGAGKSTLSSYLAGRLSRIWLREESATDAPLSEPVVPARVPARCLDGSGSWSSVLAEGIARALGRGLVEDPSPALFAGRVQGARWLVLVDGLDEIPDPKIRGEVVRSIAQHARPGSGYRFVVTTRDLPEAELTPLRLSNVGSYLMQPFGRENLEEFASKWFTAQDLSTANERAERFLRETSDGRLRELVRNPLLATIAAVSAVREPDRPLPTSRLSLYERFCGYLSRDRSGKRDLVSQLRRHYAGDPERLGFVLWMHQSRPGILSALARSRLESEDSLWSAALKWVRANAPEGVVLVDSWEDHLWEELAGSGLLVAHGKELRFLHQSFAEFLSAQACAEAIGDQFAELAIWIRRGLQKAEQTLVLFTFAMWGAHPGNDISIVLDHLLNSHDPQRVLLAGRLLAEGVAAPDAAAARVVNRLIAQARNIDDWDAHVEAFAALGALFDRAEVVERLEELANDAGLLPGWRMAAVVAFEHLRGGDRARQLLAELLPSCYGDAVRLAASIAVRLGASAVEQVRQRVLDLTDEPDADTDDLVLAAEVMRDLALADETAALAKTIMRAPASQPDHLSRAADAWYNACGDVAIGAIVELAEARPGWDHAGKARMATVLARIGVTNVAASLAESVLQSDPDDGVATEDAIAALLAARGAESIAAALTVVDRWCEGSRLDELWHVGGMLKRIAQTAPDPGVVSRVQLLLGSKASMRIGAEALIDAWLTVEGVAAAVPVMDLTERGAALQEYDRGEVAELLQKVGANAEATELAESTLQGQIGTRNIFRQAASVLLNINETTAASRLISLAKQDAWLPPEWFAGVMDALDRDGTTSQAEEALIQVADRLAAHPRAESAELRDALGMLLLYGHPSTAIEFVTEETVKRRELYINHRLDLAEGMAAVGEAESAKVVWRNILVWQEYAAKYEVQMLEEIRAAGETQWAAEQIRTLIAQMDLPAIRKARLHQMLAWLTIGGEAHYSGSHAGETVESR